MSVTNQLSSVGMRQWRHPFRRGPWENVATAVIGAGVLMLCQPFSIALYGYSFVTILFGVALFMIVTKFPD